MLRRLLRDVFVASLLPFWRIVITQVLAGVGMLLAVGVVVLVLSGLAGPLTQVISGDGGFDLFAAGAIGVVAVAVFGLFCLPFVLGGIAATIRIADDALADRKTDLLRSFRYGVALSPQLAATLVLGVGSAALLVIAAPIVSVLALLGLAVTPLVHLARRRRPDLARRWPEVLPLVWAAIPFAAGLRQLAAALLAVPALVLEKLTPIAAIRTARAIAPGMRLLVLVSSLLAFVIMAGVTIGVSLLGGLLGATGTAIAQGAAQLVVLGLPAITLAVLFRIAADRVGRRESRRPLPRPLVAAVVVLVRRPVGVPTSSGLSRTAVVTAVALVSALLVGVPAVTASAAPAAGPVVYTVTSDADSVAVSDLVAAREHCVDAGAGCTLRAALEQASADAIARSATSVTIEFSADMHIHVDPSAPLTFDTTRAPSSDTPSEEGGEGGETPPGEGGETPPGGAGTGTLTIDGIGHNITIDGDNAVQDMSLFSRSWSYALRGLEFTRGRGVEGGALFAGGRTLLVDSSTFSHSSSTESGGALYAGATTSVVNSTFFSNTVTPDPSFGGGADVFGAGNTTVINSTFKGATGGSLYAWGNQGYSFDLQNSIVDSDAQGSFACYSYGGQFTGSQNVVTHGDTTCPGVIPGASVLTGALIRTDEGHPSVLPLSAYAANPARQIGGIAGASDCPAYDERGVARPTAACDAGAYQFDPATTIAVSSSDNPAVFGDRVTFTATVAPLHDPSAVTDGTVQFRIDGADAGDPVSAAQSFSITRDDLGAGDHDVTATFTPAVGALFSGSSTSPTLVQSVSQSGTSVTLQATPASAAAGTPVTFSIAAGGSGQALSGTFSLLDTTVTPSTTLRDRIAIDSNNQATVTLDDLSPGIHRIVAKYSGDDDNSRGTSAAISVGVLSPSVTQISTDVSTAAYGVPVAISAHVTSTASATPTGLVLFRSGTTFLGSASLDENGDATLSVDDLPVGTADLTAQYQGDTLSAGDTSDATSVEVTAATTATTITDDAGSAAEFGAPVHLTATVATTSAGSTADPVGRVTFSVGGSVVGSAAVVGNGDGTATAQATTSLGDLPLGDQQVTAAFTAGDGFTDSTSLSSTVHVVAATTAVAVTTSASPSPFGKALGVTVTVTTPHSDATATGTVSLSDGAHQLGTATLGADGVASFTLSALARGTHTLRASYLGATEYSASSGEASQVIAVATTTTTVTAPSASSVFGDAVTLTVTVDSSGAPVTGVVTLVDDQASTPIMVTVTDGSGTVELPALTGGEHQFTATFAGDGDVSGSSGELSHDVTDATTRLTLGADDESISFGDQVELTATVANTSTAPTPTGSVEFMGGGVPLGTVALVNGVAVLDTRALGLSATWMHGLPIDATYVPDVGFAAATERISMTVIPATAHTTLTLTPATTTTSATATATVSTLTGSGTPVGYITFTYNNQSEGVALVDGVASITNLRFSAGYNTVTAVFHSTSDEFVASDSDAFAFATIYVAQGAPTMTFTDSATGDLVYGDSDTLTARMTVPTLTEPTGVVTFVARGSYSGERTLGTGTIARFSSSSDGVVVEASLTTSSIPAGTTSLVAVFAGDGQYGTVTSDAIARTVAQSTTTTTITAAREPGWVGEPEQFIVRVVGSSRSATPTGSVRFAIGQAVVGNKALANGVVEFDLPAQSDDTQHLTATYVPDSDNFGASTGVLDHVITRLPTTTTVSLSPTTATLGQVITASVVVAPPQGYTAATPTLPSGTVAVVDEHDTVLCYANVSAGTSGSSSGSCELAFTTAGFHGITASFTGSASYAPSSSSQYALVIGQSAPQLTLVRSSERAFVGGETTTLTWQVQGPAAGSRVTIQRDGVTICSATTLSGTCDYTFPQANNGGTTFTLSYAGNASYTAASTSLTQNVTGCVTALAPSVNTAAGGTVAVSTAPDCMGGTGYLVGDTVLYQAVPAAGWSISSWSNATVSADPRYASVTVQPYFQVVTTTVFFSVSCVTVTLVDPSSTSDIVSGQSPNCGTYSWGASANGVIYGSFQPGTKLRLSARLADTDAQKRHLVFTGWSGLSDTDADASKTVTTLTVPQGRDLRISYGLGIACYSNLSARVQGDGTLTVGEPNCTTPEGVAGYYDGSRVPVSTKANGTSYLSGWFSSGLVDSKQNDTSASGTLVVSINGEGVIATYGSCVQVNVVAQGPGTVSVDIPGNCPSMGTGWYKSGTTVKLTQSKAYYYTFGGWSGLPVQGYTTGSTTAYATLTQSGTITGKFYDPNACAAINFVSVPAGAVTMTSTLDAGSCPAGTYDVSSIRSNHGTLMATFTATPVSAVATTAQVGMSIQTWRPARDDISTAFSYPARRGLTYDAQVSGATTVVATVCQGIDANVTLISPTGQSHTQYNPSDADFINVNPIPTCPYGTGYMVPDSVFLSGNADPAGYTFQSWGGSLSSTDQYPTTPIAFDGATPYKSVTATYKVTCYSLTSNWDAVAVAPAPNCPDAPAGSHQYIGGTAVSLQATGEGSAIFRGWNGATDVNSGTLASVVMSSDRTLYANYTAKTTGEKISDAFTSAGDAIAVAMKKTVGVVSAVATGLIMGSNPAFAVLGAVAGLGSLVSMVLGAAGVSGSGLDSFNSVVGVFNSVVTYLTSITSCATMWASSTDGTPSSADQSVTQAAGTAVSREILAQRNAQQAAIEAAKAGKTVNAATQAAKQTAGRVVSAAAVGYAVYNQVASDSGGWDSSAAAAWTTGGDVYMTCMARSIPSWVGLPPVP